MGTLFPPLVEPLTSPLIVGIFSAALMYLGWVRVSRDIPSNSIRIGQKSIRSKGTWIQVAHMCLSGSATFLIALLLTSSVEISFSLSLLTTAVPFIFALRRRDRLEKLKNQAWPSAIDGIVSSLQAGESISEAINDLATHGPDELRGVFHRISGEIEDGASLEGALQSEMIRSDSGIADLALTSLLIAKEFGGRDVTSTLRVLSSFLREEGEALAEIETRFGWVRNSAVLGAVAPWLLIILLSTQESTVVAYQTATGRTILTIGVIATAVAFLWMERIARLPKPPRPLRSISIHQENSAAVN